ncbi:MAG: recombination mediator RecR [Bacteroidia bacterium]|nr:recombination mediator RecR [Bacteroidia bacterium]MDW8088400.1 recombination mediator RecR [Bacteroidia bacterium]
MEALLPSSVRSLQAVLQKLPGIGARSALRILQALLRKENLLSELAEALAAVQTQVRPCLRCGFWAEAELCPICTDPTRTEPVLCVVKDVGALLALERAQTFRGRYHILGGVLDPLARIQEKDLRLAELWQRLQDEPFEELILALGTSPEAETTTYYIARQLADWPGRITRFTSGIPVSSDLEYLDPLTLARSFRDRQRICL